MKELYPSSGVRDTDTFFKEAERVGITKCVGRQKINTRCTTVCDIYFSTWSRMMLELYPGFKVAEWASCDLGFMKLFEDEKKRVTGRVWGGL